MGQSDCITRQELQDIEHIAENLTDSLSVRERDFILGLHARTEQYGIRTFISPRQRDWLGDIVSRVVLGRTA